MTKNQVKVGGRYEAKTGSRWVVVTILGPAKTGWNAVSEMGKPVRVKDAKNLRPTPEVEETVAETEEVDNNITGPVEQPAPAEVVPIPKVAPRAPRAKRKPATAATTADEPNGRPGRPMTCLDAAIAVLRANGSPMRTNAMVTEMKDKGLWTTSAPTPAATLYSAILREIKVKGANSRFKKTDRGHFGLNG